MSENDNLLLETADAVAVLILNRPDAGNALTASLLSSLAEKLGELAREGAARCVVLKGTGARFSVGMDLNAMASGTAEENQKLIGAGGPLRRAMQAIEEFPYLVVARQLAANTPLSMKGHKRILRLLAEGKQVSPEVASEINAGVAEALGGADATEGLIAFKEKRPPKFTSS